METVTEKRSSRKKRNDIVRNEDNFSKKKRKGKERKENHSARNEHNWRGMTTCEEGESMETDTEKINLSKKIKFAVRNEDKYISKERRKGKHAAENKNSREMATHEEEERLERLVLGDGSFFLQDESEKPSCSYNSTKDDSGVEDGEYDTSPQMSDTLASPQREPAWHDEDDTNICVTDAYKFRGRKVPEVLSGGTSSDAYSRILKYKFETTMGTPAWAELDHRNTRKSNVSEDDDESDDELLRHCGNFLSNRRSSLHKGTIEIKKVLDLNYETRTEGPIIKSVQFHRSSMVGLVAGLTGITSLFQVDGKTNTKLQSIQFEQYPISCARFTSGGEQFIVGSPRFGYFHNYDMMVGRSIKAFPSSSMGIANTKNFEISPDGRLMAVYGKYGNIHLLSVQTLEGVGNFKMNGNLSAVTFDNNGTRLFSHGDEGEVYVWDIRSRRCVGRLIDDGCICGTSLSLSPGGRFLASGSKSGVVNIYETEGLLENRAPKPAKILLNLTTTVTSSKFNATSEILAIASDINENALRLVHFPSMTVFSNFPFTTMKSNFFGRPYCLDFSPGSGYLAIGNSKGRALLYRLKNYGNY